MVNPVVAIPVYKPFDRLEAYEIASFRRACAVLGGHAIALFGPDNLNVDAYLGEAERHTLRPSYERFESSFFSDINGYSALMLSRSFYERFQAHTHMLVYQLDSYVFKDQLVEWCERGYDYVGAPWIEDKSGLQTEGELTGIGNGGFSLRNVNKAIEVLTTRSPQKSFGAIRTEYSGYSTLERTLRYPIIALRAATGWRNNGHFYATAFTGNEDAFWGELLPASRYEFRLPPAELAISFSFEVAPAQLYRMNGNTLPFGCHAFARYDPGFWREFIDW